eukprot:6461085-Amphidinium_carterae.1
MQTSLQRFAAGGSPAANARQSAEVLEQLKKDEGCHEATRTSLAGLSPGSEVKWSNLFYHSIERCDWHEIAHLPNGKVPG